jgi:hypothetical protein
VALTGLTQLNHLDLVGNDIQDLSPLLDNAGIGAGDSVELSGNPIQCGQPAIAALRARGVILSTDCPE